MANRSNEYVKRRWQQLIEEFGGRCETCGSLFDLEFSHVVKTACHGKGRGKSRRLFDILRNQHAYQLLCMDCHDIFDGRTSRRRQQDYLREAV